MRVGDLIQHESDGGLGIVLRILRDVEIPSLIEVLWSGNVITRVYQDEIEVIGEGR